MSYTFLTQRSLAYWVFCTLTTQRSQFYGRLQSSLLKDNLQRSPQTYAQTQYLLSKQYSAFRTSLIQSRCLQSCPNAVDKFFLSFYTAPLGCLAILRSIRIFRKFTEQPSSGESRSTGSIAILCVIHSSLCSEMLLSHVQNVPNMFPSYKLLTLLSYVAP